MSDLGDQIQDEIDAIEGLRTAAETPAGVDGDPWAGEYEAYIRGTQAALNDAAPDSIRNADNEISADVDNDATTSDVGDFQELSVTHSGSAAISREVITTFEDADATTSLSFDTGAIGTVYSEIRVKGVVGGHGSGSNQDVKCRVNNISGTGKYAATRIGSGTIEQVSNTYWGELVFDRYHAKIDWTIHSGNQTADSTRGPSISGKSSGHSVGSYIDTGLLQDSLPVNSLQILTDFNAEAKLVIIGVSY
jgi:hypothetical protein